MENLGFNASGFPSSSSSSSLSIDNAFDPNTVIALTVFCSLICFCIVIGHLLGESRWANESITSLLLGLASGAVVLVISKGRSSRILEFNEELFFIYLLPPIIFNAGFQVKRKHFFRNFSTILTFAVLGTIISFCVISAGLLFLLKKIGVTQLDLKDYLGLGAILSATDSVCTLQVLNQDEMPFLFSIIFGEGVVNDATSIVLFNAVQSLDLNKLGAKTAIALTGTFLYLFLCSTILGILIGLLSAYTIKKLFVSRHATDREISLMMLMAYVSYMIAELMNLSGILTVFFCGIVMSHYTWYNVSGSSKITAKHAFATISFISETFMFLYVGMDAVDIDKWKDSGASPRTFLAVSSTMLGLVLVGRAAFVFALATILNYIKGGEKRKIEFHKQVTIWWAGLMRGAVTLALSYNAFSSSGESTSNEKSLMIACTIIVVLFSTLVFGSATKHIIRAILNNPKERGSDESIHQSLLENTEERGSDEYHHHLLQMNGADPDYGEIAEPVSVKRGSDGLMNHPIPEIVEQYDHGNVTGHNSGRLCGYPTSSVHRFWREFDNRFMRPVFGGQGFVKNEPPSPTGASTSRSARPVYSARGFSQIEPPTPPGVSISSFTSHFP